MTDEKKPYLNHIRITSPNGQFHSSHVFLDGKEIRAAEVRVEILPRSFARVHLTLIAQELEIEGYADISKSQSVSVRPEVSVPVASTWSSGSVPKEYQTEDDGA